MVIRYEELVILNGTARCELIHGIDNPDQYVERLDNDTALLEKTMEDLVYKKLLMKDGRYTQEGIEQLSLMKRYSEASTHVEVNGVWTATVYPEVIALVADEEGVEFRLLDPLLHFFSLMDQLPELKNYTEALSDEDKTPLPLQGEAWQASLADDSSILYIQHVENNELVERLAVYPVEDKLFLYDFINEQRVACNSEYLAAYLVQLFGVKASDLKSYRS